MRYIEDTEIKSDNTIASVEDQLFILKKDYENSIDEIKEHIKHAKCLNNSFEKDNLTISRINNEGYLKGLQLALDVIISNSSFILED